MGLAAVLTQVLCRKLHELARHALSPEGVGHKGVGDGHGAVLHGCRVGRNALIGMNAVIMDNAVIGEASIVAASAFVKASQEIPPRVLVAGMPARIIRPLSDEEIAWKADGTRTYQELTRRCLATLVETTPLTAIEPDRKRIEMPDVIPLTELKKRGA